MGFIPLVFGYTFIPQLFGFQSDYQLSQLGLSILGNGNLFGFQNNHLIMVENSDDVEMWLGYLLDSYEARASLSSRGEQYIHEEFDWYSRFNDVMKKEKIW